MWRGFLTVVAALYILNASKQGKFDPPMVSHDEVQLTRWRNDGGFLHGNRKVPELFGRVSSLAHTITGEAVTAW